MMKCLPTNTGRYLKEIFEELTNKIGLGETDFLSLQRQRFMEQHPTAQAGSIKRKVQSRLSAISSPHYTWTAFIELLRTIKVKRFTMKIEFVMINDETVEITKEIKLIGTPPPNEDTNDQVK